MYRLFGDEAIHPLQCGCDPRLWDDSHVFPLHTPRLRLPIPDLNRRTEHLGRELLAAARPHRTNLLWSEKLIAHTLEDEAFKTELFRFVDVFPVLKTPAEIHKHLMEYLDQPHIKLPTHIALTLKAGGLLKGTLANTIAAQITNMAGRFISGHDLAPATSILQSRWNEGIAFSVDLLGEAVVSHAEAAAYRQRYLDLIEQLPRVVAAFPANPTLDNDHLGPIPRANVSIKISALDGHVSPIDTEGSIERLLENISPLLKAARTHNIFINFDMEHHALKDLTIRFFKRCCETYDFPACLALQAYLQSAEADARDLAQWSRDRQRVITIRLIKGAYWDFETIHAQLQNWPVPVWQQKAETDAGFERVTSYLLQETPRTIEEAKNGGIKLALGTHNARSIAHAIAVLEELKLPPSAVEFQALRGMADDLKLALAQGAPSLTPARTPWRVREYQPLGELIPGMAYLVRRLLENTSNESWLHADHTTNVSDEALLAAPDIGKQEARSQKQEELSHPRGLRRSPCRIQLWLFTIFPTNRCATSPRPSIAPPSTLPLRKQKFRVSKARLPLKMPIAPSPGPMPHSPRGATRRPKGVPRSSRRPPVFSATVAMNCLR